MDANTITTVKLSADDLREAVMEWVNLHSMGTHYMDERMHLEFVTPDGKPIAETVNAVVTDG